MSRYHLRGEAITLHDITARKSSGGKLSMVTCYDAAFARLVDKTEIDMVLVGDSLGNVMLGHDDTIPVTLADMLHHARAVSRILRKPFLCVDMPFLTYSVSVEQALTNAGRLVQEGRAQAVKVEGGSEIAPQIAAMVKAGIPVMGHLGLTPQSIHTVGGYRVQGRGNAAARKIIDDASALEQAGAFSVVLELVPAPLAEQISQKLKIPTVGIGAGAGCDGQVLVLQDLLGFDAEFKPKFLKKYAELGNVIVDALNNYDRDVKEGVYPDQEHSFSE